MDDESHVSLLAVQEVNQLNLARSIHDLIRGDEVEIRALPRHLERTCTKRGFKFNLLVAGSYDLGQEELVDTLFGVSLRKKIDQDSNHAIKQSEVEVVDGPVKLQLKVLTTPNFGMRLDETGSFLPIIENLENRLTRHLHNESQLYRKKDTPDERIHLCLYMLPPAGLALHPNDYECITRLCKICNVIPVIARSDMLTAQECLARKQQVLEALRGISLFQLPVGEADMDERPWLDHLKRISERQPFACMYNSTRYDPNDDSYSDTRILRAAIIAHMCELVDSTHYQHYEEFRAKYLMEKHCSARGTNEIKNSDDEAEYVDQAMHEMRIYGDVKP